MRTVAVSRGSAAQKFLREAAQAVNWRIASTVIVLGTLSVVFHLTSHGIFFTPRNLSLLLRQASLVAILAAGSSVLMVMAEIDLSMGGTVPLTGAVAAELTLNHGMPAWVGVLAAVACGVALGAWNGLWVTRFGVPSFVVTLAGLLGFGGVALMWTNAATLGPLPQGFINLSEGFISKTISFVILVALGVVLVGAIGRRYQVRRRRAHQAEGQGEQRELAALILHVAAVAVLIGLSVWIVGGFLGLPAAVLWVIGVGAAVTFIAMRTKFGRNAFMIGANREAAHLSGINVKRTILFGFLLMGVLYGVAGVLMDARLASWSPSADVNVELDAIAAAVIGGTSLLGGVATIPGSMVGALLLATIDNGMSLDNVNSFLEQVVKGLILLVAVALDQWARRRERMA